MAGADAASHAQQHPRRPPAPRRDRRPNQPPLGGGPCRDLGAWFVSTFSHQKSGLFVGQVACSGQLCQKQLSTNNARRASLKTMTGQRHAATRTERSTQYLNLRAWRAWRSSSSGLMSRRPVRATRALVLVDAARRLSNVGPGNVTPPSGASESSFRGVLRVRKSDPSES